jgi:hypothetical protein
MKILLVLAAVVALASCRKEEGEPIFRRNVIISGADTIVIETQCTYSNFWQLTSVSKCRSSHGYGDTIEIMQPTIEYEFVTSGFYPIKNELPDPATFPHPETIFEVR